MEIISHLVDGFAVAGSPTNLMICLIGAFLGTIIGMLPGLGPINGVAILLPIAYAMKLPPESALILLAAVYSGCEFGGRISAILINVPGDAGAVMTTLDGYPMARTASPDRRCRSRRWPRSGRHRRHPGHRCLRADPRQLGAGLRAGRIFRADGAGLSCLGGLVGDSLLKAMVGVLIGLMLACVGIDSNSGVYRYTFDLLHLSTAFPSSWW